MNNLEYAIINEFSRVKFYNELDVMTAEQENIINELCDKSWSLVSEKDLNKISFNGDFRLVASLILLVIIILLHSLGK